MKKYFFNLIFLSISLASTSALACYGTSDSKLCRGDRVLTSNGNIGYIQEIFNNGKAVVDYDSTTNDYIWNASDLSKGVKCFSKFCVKSKVLTSSGKMGYVQEIFNNGKALIDYDSTTNDYIWSTFDLSKEVKCFDRFCVADRILTSTGYKGYAQQIFDNGKILVDYDSTTNDYIWSTSKLGKGFRCSGNLCVKDRVLTTSGHTGYAQEIFDNGKVIVDYDSTTNDYIWSIESLGYELDCYN